MRKVFELEFQLSMKLVYLGYGFKIAPSLDRHTNTV